MNNRYILDALYGIIYLPEYIWEVMFIPEFQRLRELRLYNINSLYFTGGANINRFEHSIGTCYLALKCIESNHNNLSTKEKMLIVLAALFHDLYNGAFGHSLEYVEKGFSPEDLFFYAATGKKYDSYKYKHAFYEPIYFGMREEISSKLTKQLKLSEKDIETIGKYIRGMGSYGPLISGTMDLDNIDNVYRMSYHMGLIRKTQTPLKIAKSLWIQNGKLYIKKKAIPLVKEWISTRERLYKFLLLNPDEFSAKFMLTDAIELSKLEDKKHYLWHDTDFQLLQKLSESSSDVSNIVSRLMKGSYYGCFGLYKTTKIEKFEELFNYSTRIKIENKINQLIMPEVCIRLPNFSIDKQNIIKGIKGISYDNQTCELKLSYKANKETIDLLINNELKEYKNDIEKMYLKIKNRLSSFKVKSPQFGIHPILDINKTNREVVLNLPDNELLKIGSSSNCFYIGVFIRNEQFANFNLLNNKELNTQIVQNIKNEIKNFLISYLNDRDLIELELYAEVGYGR